MAINAGDRATQFPLIERKYGQPVAHWLERLADLEDGRYAVQMAYLQEEHGFSRAHANTLVMYARGSKSTRRFDSPDDYFDALPAVQAATARRVFSTLTSRFPELDLVIAWNQPMLRLGSKYVFGLSAASQHLLLAPWGEGVLELVAPRMTGLTVKKKTIQVPSNWDVDTALLVELVGERVRQLRDVN